MELNSPGPGRGGRLLLPASSADQGSRGGAPREGNADRPGFIAGGALWASRGRAPLVEDSGDHARPAYTAVGVPVSATDSPSGQPPGPAVFLGLAAWGYWVPP